MADNAPDGLEDGAVDTPSPDDAPKKGGKLKLIVGLVVVLAAAGLGGSVAFSKYVVLDRTAGVLFASDETEDEDAPIEYGEFMQIDGLVVNPAGTGGSRYLMVSVGLEAADAGVLEEVGMKDIVVRDAVIALLSSKTVDELADIALRDEMKDEIRGLINRILSEGEIDRLYFTQFMLQ